MENQRRRRVDRFELAIIGSFVLNLTYLVLAALGLLRTDGSHVQPDFHAPFQGLSCPNDSRSLNDSTSSREGDSLSRGDAGSLHGVPATFSGSGVHPSNRGEFT